MAMSNFTAAFNRFKALLNQYSNATIDMMKVVRDRLNSHTDAVGNVHDLEPADIGLGNVPDWLPATTDQAKSALSNSAFMTPRRTNDYANENIFAVIGGSFKAAADKL
ncbi:virion structural protein [Pseudomonas phage Phabio]|uniref:Virion structural protein n=1 Tax=Pseudomonas phage Phabio TaxID=2006668 RepID=A0A1Y0SWH2_9CAUD|nr:tail protein [Pseudomonas phage Phabio]ARV76835.1 virion structural protein [Pseudomonas phage Phabio]